MLKSKSLQLFAEEIEDALIRGGTSLVNEVCRHITGKNEKVASFMAAKVVEWRYGKAIQTMQAGDSKEPLGLGFNEPTSEKSSRVC